MTSIEVMDYGSSERAIMERLRAEYRASEPRPAVQQPPLPEVALVEVPDFGFSVIRFSHLQSVPARDGSDDGGGVPVYEMVTEELPLEEALARIEEEEVP